MVDEFVGTTGTSASAHFDKYTVQGFTGKVAEQILWLADSTTSGRGLGTSLAQDEPNDDQWSRSSAVLNHVDDTVYYNKEAPYPALAVPVYPRTLSGGGENTEWRQGASQPQNLVLGQGSTSQDADASKVRSYATETERVEGYLAHKYGLQHLLPQGASIDSSIEHKVAKVVLTDAGSRVSDPGITEAVVISATDGTSSGQYLVSIVDGYVVYIEKYDQPAGPPVTGSAVVQSFNKYPTFDISTMSGFDGDFHIVWEDLWEGHPFAVNAPATGGGGRAAEFNTIVPALYGEKASVAKFRPVDGMPVAVFTGAGVGFGVTVDQNDDLFCVGPTDSTGTELEPYTIARKLINEAESFSSSTAAGAFVVVNMTDNETSEQVSDWDTTTADTTLDQTGERPQCATDVDGNFYWPVASSATTAHLYRFKGTQQVNGAYVGVLRAKTHLGGTDADWVYALDEANKDEDGAGTAGYQSGVQNAYSISFDPVRPLFPNYGLNHPANITGPESLYLTTDSDSGNRRSLHKLTVVKTTMDQDFSGTPRKSLLLSVNQGNIQVLEDGAKRVPTGGADALYSESRHLQSEVLFNKVFYTDGLTYKYYDPRGAELDTPTDRVYDWISKSGGEMPKRGKLLCGWRGRMVIAHLADDPQEWHMSKQGDPFNWDLYPPVLNAQQAVSGTVSKIGKVPDLINALIPYNDDLMIVGGDHTLWRFTGDPMFGGQLDLISDVTGMSFGRPWCKDPEGVIYFFGSRGGVYAMTPQGLPQRITIHSIDRRLADIDLATYRVELIWNTRDDGLHLFKIPYAAGGQIISHFFWERKTGAWFEDEFGDTSLQPTAATVLDGDAAADRAVLVGGEDGVVRRWTETVASDDGFAINSKVLIGPVVPPSSDSEVRVDRLEGVLADAQGGVRYEIIATDNPDTIPSAYTSGAMGPGRNPVIRARARGAAVYVRLANSSTGERWSLEDLAFHATSAGRRRVRQ